MDPKDVSYDVFEYFGRKFMHQLLGDGNAGTALFYDIHTVKNPLPSVSTMRTFPVKSEKR